MNKLWVRLSLGFSGVLLSAILVVAMTGLMFDWLDSRTEQREILDRVSTELTAYYQAQQSWAGSETILAPYHDPGFHHRRGPDWDLFLSDATGTIIYYPQAENIGLNIDQFDPIETVPIQVNGQIVGQVGLTPPFGREGGRNFGVLGFVAAIGRGLLIVTIFAGISGVIFGIIMSRSLTAPLNNLADTAKSFSMRNLSHRAEETGSDEMVAVAQAFNEMATGLEEAEQLRRNLLADVAHELRTPISVLQANLRAILDEVYPLNQEEVARLYDHSRLLGRLVSDLHELAQAEAKQLPLALEETNIQQLIQNAVDTFRLGAEEKGVTLQTELPALPTLRVDAARLTQVLQNLLTNALRHTPGQGQISVKASPLSTGLEISVADTGEGIPSAHLPHIFDRFYRTDPARSRDRGGAGLGLAIARALVEAHGGQLTVESTAGQGSTFTIRLAF